MEAASRLRDCLPEPPTPTSRAWPDEGVTILVILHTCFMASSKQHQVHHGVVVVVGCQSLIDVGQQLVVGNQVVETVRAVHAT